MPRLRFGLCLRLVRRNFYTILINVLFFFSSRRRHTRWQRDWSSDVCSSDLSDADLTQASELMEAAGVQIDHTYTLMEKEIASREYIGKNQGAVQRRLEQVTQSNRYGALEDRKSVV